MGRPTEGTVAAAFALTALALAAPAASAEPWVWSQEKAPTFGAPPTLSQNFEPAMNDRDIEAAESFRIPPEGLGVLVHRVVARGQYSAHCGTGAGPARSVNVRLYRNGASFDVPADSPIAARTNVTPTAGLGSGDFDIPIDPPVPLGHPDNYWVSVQANQDCSASGEWLWDAFRPTVEGEMALRNPGGGIYPGMCGTDWVPRTACGLPEGVSLSFRLEGETAELTASLVEPKIKKLAVEAGCGVACELSVDAFIRAKRARAARSSAADAAGRQVPKSRFPLKSAGASVGASQTATIPLEFKKKANAKRLMRIVKGERGAKAKLKVAVSATVGDQTDVERIKATLKG